MNAQGAAVPVVGRLAPSPTGRLHLGHARSFLLAWWSARSQSGQVLLRIDDLDRDRVRPEFLDGCQRDLEWLGLDWDGPPILQSGHLERFAAAARQLETSGRAYPCVCLRSELRSMVAAPQAGDAEVRYPGRCRGRFQSCNAARQASGRDPVLRFLVPEGTVEVTDAFLGRFQFDVQAEIGDFPIGRRDGTPAYQLSSVVDDAAYQVTEVVRGDDLLASAARQELLFAALGVPAPRWVHVPLVLDGSGRRLAKRHDDLSLEELRARGIDPQAIVGWVARCSGYPEVDRAEARDLVKVFDLSKLPKLPVSLNESMWGAPRAAP